MSETNAKLKKILIVEDEQDMHAMYRMMFAQYKGEYEIDYEEKAQAALDRAKVENYDLIILDINMSPMPGDFFFFFLRLEENTKETPVLVVSVLSHTSLEEMKAINHIDFLQKPITEEQLIEKIRNLLVRLS